MEELFMTLYVDDALIASLVPPCFERVVRGEEFAVADLSIEVGIDRRFVGALVGRGIRTKTGLQLWIDRGGILACRQNGLRLAARLTKEQSQAVMARLSMDEQQLAERIKSLPEATPPEGPCGLQMR
jgi:hypothetical protein